MLRRYHRGVLVSEREIDLGSLGRRFSLPRRARVAPNAGGPTPRIQLTAVVLGTYTDSLTGAVYQVSSDEGSSVETIDVTKNSVMNEQTLVWWTEVGDSLEATGVLERIFDGEGLLTAEIEAPVETWNGGGPPEVDPPMQIATMRCEIETRGLLAASYGVAYAAYQLRRNPSSQSAWNWFVLVTGWWGGWWAAWNHCMDGGGLDATPRPL